MQKTPSTPTKTESTPNIDLRGLVAMQFLHISGVQFTGQKIVEAYKKLQISGVNIISLSIYCWLHHIAPMVDPSLGKIAKTTLVLSS